MKISKLHLNYLRAHLISNLPRSYASYETQHVS